MSETISRTVITITGDCLGWLLNIDCHHYYRLPPWIYSCTASIRVFWEGIRVHAVSPTLYHGVSDLRWKLQHAASMLWNSLQCNSLLQVYPGSAVLLYLCVKCVFFSALVDWSPKLVVFFLPNHDSTNWKYPTAVIPEWNMMHVEEAMLLGETAVFSTWCVAL